ncbi:MAG: RidA family protein, partial [Thermoguttaceae bacterium]|nr:RidA family protein [Thermoguttaceae bacterium]
MAWRSSLPAALALCLVALAGHAAAQDAVSPSIQYLPLDAPAGMSQAVIVQGMALVHTRQLLPLDREGKLVGEGSPDEQIEKVLANLEAVLADSGSGMDKLVRVNVYALSTGVVSSFREHLAKRLGPNVRPAITSVLTPLPHRNAVVAADAVAGAADSSSAVRGSPDPARALTEGLQRSGETSGREARRGQETHAERKAVVLRRCPSVAGDPRCADAAVLPRGGVAYLSGQPDEGGLSESAAARSMSGLMRTLGHLKLSPADVVQVKVFLRPMTSSNEVLREVQKFFPGQITPPVVFVEWLAAVPVEIELIARFPVSGKPARPVEYFTPPEVRPS